MTPYVYKITHKPTGKYYIGSKYAGWRNNKEVTELIGEDYYTSSRDKFIVETFTKERVQDWDIKIIYRTRGDEHDPPAEAVAHEHLFIGECIEDELCLNKYYIDPYINKTVVLYDYNETSEKARVEKAKKTKAQRTPEQKAKTSRKLSERERNRAPEKEAERNRKRLATLAAKSPEERAETRHKQSQTHQNKSPEEKAARIEKIKATKARRTPEQEAERIRKMNATKMLKRGIKR